LNRQLELDSVDLVRTVVGPSDSYVRRMREVFGVAVVARGRRIMFEGDEMAVGAAVDAMEEIVSLALSDGEIGPDQVADILSAGPEDDGAEHDNIGPKGFEVDNGKFVRPRTRGQWEYARAIATHDIVFATGPAGTGKTYLAVAAALTALKRGEVNRIVLARPAVEAGEKLGFLPGDLMEKVNPYLRPLYDALQDMISFDKVEKYIAKGVIEILPVAFMRGRTFNRAAVILDEAQNTSSLQMKMFLTRLGLESKATITGDITQIDLETPEGSGLVVAGDILSSIEEIAFCRLTEVDIVRHPLVRRIVGAYEKHEGQKRRPEAAGPSGGKG